MEITVQSKVSVVTPPTGYAAPRGASSRAKGLPPIALCAVYDAVRCISVVGRDDGAVILWRPSDEAAKSQDLDGNGPDRDPGHVAPLERSA